MTRYEKPPLYVTALLWLFCFSLVIPLKIRTHIEEERYYRTWKPKPLRKRRRRLTTEASTPYSARYYSQEKSPFFRLPPEIRRMIYEEILGGQTFHIMAHASTGAWRHTRCRASLEGRHSGCFEEIPMGRMGGEPFVYQGIRRRAPFDGNMIPFLRSCRRIYSETIDVMYGANTFNFSNDYCGPSQFAMIARSQRLQAVKRVQMEFGFMHGRRIDHTMQEPLKRLRSHVLALQQMTNLLELTIVIGSARWYTVPENDALSALVGLKDIKNFEVILEQGRQPGSVMDDEWPFKITRSYTEYG